MHDMRFQEYLSEKTDIDLITISDIFDSKNDVFKVALELIEKYGVDDQLLGKIWGDYLGFAYVNPCHSIVSHEHIKMLGADFIREHKVIPLYKFGKAVTVATSNPAKFYIQDKLEKKFNSVVSFVFCFPFDIDIFLSLNNIAK